MWSSAGPAPAGEKVLALSLRYNKPTAYAEKCFPYLSLSITFWFELFFGVFIMLSCHNISCRLNWINTEQFSAVVPLIIEYVSNHLDSRLTLLQTLMVSVFQFRRILTQSLFIEIKVYVLWQFCCLFCN